MNRALRILLASALTAMGACHRAEPAGANSDVAAPGPGAPTEAPAIVRPAPDAAKSPQAPPGSPCLAQDGKPVAAPAFKLVGTEPFWGGTTQGRCVTYSTPERPNGTRLWTRVSSEGGGWRYAGALDGQPFTLILTPKAGCSDGMSDRRYPYAAELHVGGSVRSGCAS